MQDKIVAVWAVGAEAPSLWYLPSRERLDRLSGLMGLPRIDQEPAKPGFELAIRIDFLVDARLVEAVIDAGPCILLNKDREPVLALFDARSEDRESLLKALAQGSFEALPTTLPPKRADQIVDDYHSVLRKKQRPLIKKIDVRNRYDVEWEMFHASYKGATDFVTKYIWPWPAFFVTRWCARRGITPNQVTTVSLLFVFLAIFFFSRSAFGIGLVCAWLMTFLDTVDGKLARVTVQSSRWGNVFDHGIDLIHPPFWYYAWFIGIGGTERGPLYMAAAIVILVGYLAGRLQEGLFIWLFKIEIHTWKKLDYRFRLITARRNPNLFLLMLFYLLLAPAEGFLAVAIWTIISFAFHCWRLYIAFLEYRRVGSLKSWLQDA